MEILTEKIEKYIEAYQLPPFGREVVGTVELLQEVSNKLAEYEDLEEKGLLLRLPCKVGSTVYRIENGKVTQTKITKYELYADGSIWFSFSTSLGLPISKFNIGVFITKAEAEQKLKEMESK